MDSLIASYASSDDEDESPPQQKQQHNRVQFPPNSAIDEPQAASDNDDDVSESKLRAHGKPFSSFLSLPKPKSNPSPSPSSVFASLPRPQSSSSESVSLFSSLPPPGSSSVSARVPIRGDSNSRFGTIHVDGIDDEEEDSYGQSSSLTKVSSKLFSVLPRPKSRAGEDGILNLGLVERNGKKVVQFRPPIGMTSTKKYEYDDDEEEEEEERKKPQEIPHSASVKSFLSSIPAPKNSSTLGVLPSSTSGHRLVVEEKKTSESLGDSRRENEVAADDNIPSDQGVIVDWSKQSNSYSVNWAPVEQNYAGYESYGSYENYAGHHGVESYADHHGVENYGTYRGSWDCGASVGMASETPVAVDSFIKAAGKRGRDKVPTEIVEVKQDELIKDRPREDQVKLTGIAFGPAYQPASSKMKPSKLHKRKHQIGSLFYDMKQKEMELAERRAKGFLTKAETQAKYGW